MSRSSWAQRTGPRGRPLFSASQMSKRKCRRRWGFIKLDGLTEESGPNAVRGTAAHEEVELFLKLGKIPSTKWALRALKYAPPPGVAEVECPVRFDRWACWLGYIDLVYAWEFDSYDMGLGIRPGAPGAPRQLSRQGGDVVVIHDWKFTGSLRNAKSVAELEKDPAACLYAYEAFLGGAYRVIGRWVYIEMNDKAAVQEVWFDLWRETVEQVVAELDNEAMLAESDVVKYRKGELRVLDLDYNENQCYSFNQQCPFFAACGPQKRFSLTQAKETTMATDFKSSMDARFPTGGKTPPPSSKAAGGPPPPSSKGAPPPSSKAAGGPPPPSSKKQILSDEDLAAMRELAAENVGKVEKGSVNSPEADDTAPNSPEEAAARQANITETKAVEKDDLDDLPGDEKAQRALVLQLALQIGAVEEGTKMRLVGLRNAVRVKRKQDGYAQVQIMDGKVVDLSDDAALAAAINAEEHGADGAEQARKEIEAKFARTERKGQVAEAVTENQILEDLKYIAEMPEGGEPNATITSFPHKGWPRPADADPRGDFTLLVNGLLVATDYDLELLDQNAIMREVHEKLGVPDFRLIDYGKGPGEVACCVRAMAEEGFFSTVDLVYIDTRTDFGRVLVDVLSEFASTVLRGA